MRINRMATSKRTKDLESRYRVGLVCSPTNRSVQLVGPDAIARDGASGRRHDQMPPAAIGLKYVCAGILCMGAFVSTFYSVRAVFAGRHEKGLIDE
jgi:hypothetical protein